jgi:hypothetical protein
MLTTNKIKQHSILIFKLIYILIKKAEEKNKIHKKANIYNSLKNEQNYFSGIYVLQFTKDVSFKNIFSIKLFLFN